MEKNDTRLATGFLNTTNRVLLVLSDGSAYRGYAFGADGEAYGEVVFNTSMTGYQEMLTDPSYAGQLVTLTFPHVGNTGCNRVDEESSRPMAAGRCRSMSIPGCSRAVANFCPTAPSSPLKTSPDPRR